MPYKDKAERNKSLKKWRKRAEEQGFCNCCTKNKVSVGFKVCDACRGKKLEQYAKRKKHASENNQCVDCKTSITNDGLRCRTCSKKHSLIGVNKRQKARADKKCTMCFFETVEGEYSMCITCRSTNSEMKSKKYHDDIDRKREDAVGKGLCTTCFKTQADEGFTSCKACRDYGREHSRTQYHVQAAKAREHTKCSKCLKRPRHWIPERNYKLCIKCLEYKMMKRENEQYMKNKNE